MAKSERLPRYAGPLNPNDAAIGIRAARLNALSLLEVAKKLFNSKKYALSTALSILAIEEATKPAIILCILLSDNPAKIRKLWKEYRTHTAKGQVYRYAISSVVHGRHPNGQNKKLLKLVIDKTPRPEVIEFTKQLMLYSDCFTGKVWTLPEDQASVEKTKFVLDDARAIILALRDYPPEELAIWKRHLCGLAHMSPQETRNSFKALHDELLHKKFIKPGWWKRILDSLGLEENPTNR